MTQREKILNFMQQESYKPLLLDELIAVLSVPRSDGPQFVELLTELENEGQIIKTKKHRYGAIERMGLIVGRFQGNERGFGFLIPDDALKSDVFIPAEACNSAMNGDRIIVRVASVSEKGKRLEGEVVRVITRANYRVVGTFESNRNYGFVVPDEKKLSKDIFVSKEDTLGAKHGQKVVVEITHFGELRRNPEGVVVEIIGFADDEGVDILTIMKQFELNEDFPGDVEKDAAKYSDIVSEIDIAGRLDLRNKNIVTIDGDDAKDLDDAVCVEKIDQNTYRLGVHIADVSHYVKDKSPLDKEAYKRGTSVYLVDRVVPMLPRKLSNGICSLNPQVDRLTLSCIMDIDKSGKVISYDIKKSVIKTKERMTYNNVTKILEGTDEEVSKRYEYLIPDFKLMHELALVLQDKRRLRGSIEFDFPEAKIILNEKGKPIDIHKYEITISNNIIEEFMLICNETVAEHMFWLNKPFVYRVHQPPNEEKIQNFVKMVTNMGYTIKGMNDIQPKALQEVLDQCKGKKEERIISHVMLRSLMKARYSQENLGHFGLAAKYYCHFTSPIRRYPDLVIHRIISELIEGRLTEQREENLHTFVVKAAKQSSEREIVSVDAERQTNDLKKTEYMAGKIGERFTGIISTVTGFGFFVELDNTIDGLVRVSALEDDYYTFDEVHMSLVGEHKGKIFKIGDEVEVELVRANIPARQIDFILV